MAQLKTFVFDFDGVLCHDKFYHSELKDSFPNIVDWIQREIFGNRELVDSWMRGILKSNDINRVIATNCGIDFALLDKMFRNSVRRMLLDVDLLTLILELKKVGYPLCLVTDNMDIFSEITITNLRLNKIFDVIVNSADYGFLKKERGGALFDIALTQISCPIQETILIDDSLSTIEMYANKGGQTFPYKNFESFNEFARNNF